jgi:hypothetical protein
MLSKEEYLQRMRDPKWYGDQDENGVDLSLIRHNLKLTPEERLLRGDRAKRGAMELRAIGRKFFNVDPDRIPDYIEDNEPEVELTSIRENLRLSPEERLINMERIRGGSKAGNG